jgi:hypothetical protein
MRHGPRVLSKILVSAAVVATTVIVAIGVAAAEPGFSPTQAIPVPSGVKGSDAQYGSVSCASASSCTAVGATGNGDPFVVNEASGTWGTPQLIALPAGGVSGWLGITCPSAGDCLAAGGYTTSSGATLPLLVEESSGTWGAAASAAPPADALTGSSEDAAYATPWCSSPGTCEVVGNYAVGGSSWRLMAATETSGSWGTTAALPGVLQGLPTGASATCTQIGKCVAVSQTSGWTETGGIWSSPTQFALAQNENLSISGVACPSTTTCIAVGTMDIFTCSCRPAIEAASITETSGAWGAPVIIARPQLTPYVLIADLSGIACQPNVCVAVGSGGSYNDNDPYEQPIAATWSSGTWSSMGIEQFSPAANNETNASWLNGVACGSATQCFAVGYAGVYENGSGPMALYPYSTTLTPTRPIVAPGSPSGLSVVPMIGGAQVAWTPPTDDGGAPITSYTATASPGGASCTTTSYGCTITGLTDGHEYVVSITDSNGTIESAPVDYFAFAPGAVPKPPTKLHVFRTRSRAVISWTRATAPAGEPVRYLANVHGKGHELHSCVSTTRLCTVRGLVKGRTYVAVLYAIDATGKSSPARIRFVAK